MSNTKKLAVLGAGAWGTAVAKSLAEKGHNIALWAREPDLVKTINEQHVNNIFLPGCSLPDNIIAITNPVEAVKDAEAVFLAVPSPYLLAAVKSILSSTDIREGRPLIAVLTKGFIETDRGPRFIVETIEDYLPGFYKGNLVYISGPSHAEEVGMGIITGLTAASLNGRNAIRVRELLQSQRLLVFPSLDIIGVQVCGAVKNIIAIAFGMMDALKAKADNFGDNTESLLLAAGLNEIQALGFAMGATHPETFTSLAGVGDLDVTCRSIHGRNRRFGKEIVEKDVLKNFKNANDLLTRINELGYLPEGAPASIFVKKIMEDKRLDLPICRGVHRILDKELSAIEFLNEFLGNMPA